MSGDHTSPWAEEPVKSCPALRWTVCIEISRQSTAMGHILGNSERFNLVLRWCLQAKDLV